MSNLRLVPHTTPVGSELIVALVCHGGFDYDVSYRRPIAGPGTARVAVTLGPVLLLLEDPDAARTLTSIAKEVTDTAHDVWNTA